jgi:hypothetical protein
MKTLTKLKPSEMTPEVMAMVDTRRQAEQRGHYEPLGRLLTLVTARGIIQWPAENGEGVGPDLAVAYKLDDKNPNSPPVENIPDHNCLLVLGSWSGLPALRHNSTTPCPKCRHACDLCDGSGKKICEGLDCGGRGWTEGMWVSCPGPGCLKDSGHYKADCATCATSAVQGQIREHVECLLCKGTGQMVCSRCRGMGMFSTGQSGGLLDWRLPKCKWCAGTGWKGKLVKQDVAKFTNARLDGSKLHKSKAELWNVLGPISAFTLMDFQGRPRAFDSLNAPEDFLVMLVPASPRQKPQKAYLVGGQVRERQDARGAA